MCALLFYVILFLLLSVSAYVTNKMSKVIQGQLDTRTSRGQGHSEIRTFPNDVPMDRCSAVLSFLFFPPPAGIVIT